MEYRLPGPRVHRCNTLPPLACLLLALVLIPLTGCVTTYPGGDSDYTINTRFSRELIDRETTYSYHWVRDSRMRSGTAIGTFYKLHELTLSWNTATGERVTHVVDIAEKMKEMRARQTVRFPTGNGSLFLHEKDSVFLVDWEVSGSGVPSFHYYNLATFALE